MASSHSPRRSHHDRLLSWAGQSPAEFVLGVAEHQRFVDGLAAEIGAELPDAEALRALEAEARALTEVDLAVELAIKLALSRRLVLDHPGPVHLSVVFAVYNEHHRLGRPDEHPHGEDALARKIEQLDALVAGCPSWSWDLTVVDDGCPNGSGGVARRIADRLGRQKQVRVLFLRDAIAEGGPVVQGLSSVADSRKGGAIHLGMWEAASTAREGHVVVFTDADLSTHLGQCGRLVAPIVSGDASVCIGSRRESESVVVKGGARDDRGRLFIYLWKRMLGALDGVTDTQCGFKAFAASSVRPWVESAIEKGFAFDIELLLLAERASGAPIPRIPVAWIDSEEASTTVDLQPYLTMLQSVAALARHHRVADAEAEAFVRLVEDLDEPAWQRLQDRIPEAIVAKEPLELESLGVVVSAETLRRISGLDP